MHYLITGHTGFKGSWLSLILHMQGHTVSGIALDPEKKSLFNQANISQVFHNDFRIDIRNKSKLSEAFSIINPDVVVHLAAQPLVRESYEIPVETFEINTIGTLNVLEATRNLADLKAILIITTDKVYKNRNLIRGYLETDELGGDDPYSASKAAADLAAQSWIKCFATIPVCIARAGNVIGGGDWSTDRVIPDLVRAYSQNKTPLLRNPNAVRPWQHVLDCLHGYLMLIDHMLYTQIGGEWNFGPLPSEIFSVHELVSRFAMIWGQQQVPWLLDVRPAVPETDLLLLDSTKSREILGWKDRLDFDTTLKWTCEWYKKGQQADFESITRQQIQNFLAQNL